MFVLFFSLLLSRSRCASMVMTNGYLYVRACRKASADANAGGPSPSCVLPFLKYLSRTGLSGLKQARDDPTM